MIRVNLLPYREQRRKALILRDSLGAGAFLLVTVALFTALYFHLQGLERRHRQRVEFMESALERIQAKLDEVSQLKKKRQALVDKIEVIKELQKGRARSVRLLQTLGQAVPEEVSLRSVRQTNSGIKVEGAARSNSVISSFMRRLEASELFRDPDLKVITSSRRNGEPVKAFQMAVALDGLGKDGDGRKDGEKG